MDTFIYLGLIVLILVAFVDLYIGVSNDAVNFLNSGIGSKVAKFNTILTVATFGVIIGALSSAGMMEVTKSGIFNPEYFSFYDLILIFISVMITDIILLDAFNTLGLPTSTTVAIVFELLGATLVLAASKILSNNEPLNYLFNINDPTKSIIGYINWSKTISIITGIFVSVFIAFTVGVIVMWISRLIFSFNYKSKIKFVGIIWCTLSMLALSYFLIFKGLKTSYSDVKINNVELVSYLKAIDPKRGDEMPLEKQIKIVNLEGKELVFDHVEGDLGSKKAVYKVFFGSKTIKDVSNYIQEHMLLIQILNAIFWFFFFVFLNFKNINPFRFVVLAGIFSLAMAFAGNDLVNFVGVPISGIQIYELFQNANSIAGGTLDPKTFMMGAIKFPSQAPYLYLFLSGVVMALTLWFSKKARTVNETEIRLANQEESTGPFVSNALSRGLVRGSVHLATKIKEFVPLHIQNQISRQFIPVVYSDDTDPPAFDLIRASANVTISSLLIAMGTSLKLPLSTTYVTFMVAMGTSLADQAWGRESATYRIAGVFRVIAGWFMTAIIAASVSAVVALVLISFELYGLIFLVIGLISILLYTNFLHKNKLKDVVQSNIALNSIDLTTDKSVQKTSKKLSESLANITNIFSLIVEGLLKEDKEKINEASTKFQELDRYFNDIKSNLFKAIKKSKLSDKQTVQLYVLSNDLMQDVLLSLGDIIKVIETHVINAHKPLTPIQADLIKKLEIEVVKYINSIAISIDHGRHEEFSEFKPQKNNIFDQIEYILSRQVEGISQKAYGFKNSDLVMNLLLETKDLVAISVRFSKLLNRISKGESPLGNRNN